MFLKQVSYNGYLFRDIAHGKAQNSAQRRDTQQGEDSMFKTYDDTEALKDVEHKRMQQVDAQGAVREPVYQLPVLEVMILDGEEKAEHRACHYEVRHGEIAEQPAVGIAAVIGVPDVPDGLKHGGQQKNKRREPERPSAVFTLA